MPLDKLKYENKEITEEELKFFKILIEKMETRNETIQEIINKPDYINWLEKFCLENNHGFDSDTWDYCQDKISKENLENVLKLPCFFEGIENWATNNYIELISEGLGGYYSIKHNNFGYNVGVAHGQGTLFYIEQIALNKENENNFIDFNEIKNNLRLESAKKIDISIKKLRQITNNLLNQGLSVNTICNIVSQEKTLNLKRKRK